MLPLPSTGRATPLGATPVTNGVNFRVWAPRAHKVYLVLDGSPPEEDSAWQLQPLGDGTWYGFAKDVSVGRPYCYLVAGPGGKNWKRDPRARLLTVQPSFPDALGVIRVPDAFPWHNTGYRTPAFENLILYQIHVGTFHLRPGATEGKFLDVALQLPYLRSLGINGLQLMPVDEFPTMFSLGYNGTDYFSPENDYGVHDDGVLPDYFARINGLLAAKGLAPYSSPDALRRTDDQLRALVDLCHAYGVAVLFDVVYNHAGGDFGNHSLYFFDMMPYGNFNDSLYFTDREWAGGLGFAYWNDDVKQFLIDHAKSLIEEYRIDGMRFDEVSVMDRFGGWKTCQDITGTCRYVKPEALFIAEYWPVNPCAVTPAASGGAGFDATWHDQLRNAVRQAISVAAQGADARVPLNDVAAAIASDNLGARWRAVQCVEDHDIVRHDRGDRIARLADPSNPRSWYARSRARVAMGLLLTAPGIPMIFMGQEFLEDKRFSDDAGSGHLLYWDGLQQGDKAMADHLRSTSELIATRWRQPALRGEPVRVHHADEFNRIIAFHRWLEGIGRDVVVVASLSESTRGGYRIGFPSGGRWLEVFNSDVYDNWVNPQAAGNGGGIHADGMPYDGMPVSAEIVIPANSVLVFARDFG